MPWKSFNKVGIILFCLAITVPLLVPQLNYRPVRINSQQTPTTGRILDLDFTSRSSVVSRLSGPGQVSANTKNNLQINPFFKQMPFSSTAIEGDDAVFEESDQVDVPPTLPQPPPNSR